MSEFLLEFKRQVVHLSLGMGIALAIFFLFPFFGHLLLVPLILAIFLLYTIPKLSKDAVLFNHLLFHFEREQDVENFPFKGAIHYGMGIVLPILLLPVNVACAIIAVLSTGDSMSTLMGKFLGRRRIGDKSLEGFLSFVLFGFFAAGIFVSPPLAMVLAFLGGGIELFSRMDDNFTIPVGLTLAYLAWMFV